MVIFILLMHFDLLYRQINSRFESQPALLTPRTGTDVHLMTEALTIILRPMIRALIQMEDKIC